MPPITIYTTPWCPYCQRAKLLLKRKGAAFQEIDVQDDPAERKKMTVRSGGQYTVPQIFIGETHVGGCDDLMRLMQKAGLIGCLKFSKLPEVAEFWGGHG